VPVTKVAPDKYHCSTRRSGQNDQSGNVTVQLFHRQPAGEQMADKNPREQGHRKGFNAPIDEKRHANTFPVLPYVLQ